jgi:hypothetical protein
MAVLNRVLARSGKSKSGKYKTRKGEPFRVNLRQVVLVIIVYYQTSSLDYFFGGQRPSVVGKPLVETIPLVLAVAGSQSFQPDPVQAPANRVICALLIIVFAFGFYCF